MKGRPHIKLHDGEVRIRPGEFVVIPRGVDHLPIAEEEVHVILIEKILRGHWREETTRFVAFGSALALREPVLHAGGTARERR